MSGQVTMAILDLESTYENETYNVTSPYGDVDVNAYMETVMGEKRRDIASVAVLTYVYGLIFILGLSGNICTCIVIARNTYMHTATNYYLFSLAVSDMLTLIFGLPTELYGIWEAYPWRFGEAFCIFKSFLSEITAYASVLTITAFTIERYVAICHPIKAQTLSNLSRAMKTVVMIWILSCLCAVPYPIHTRLFPYVTLNGTAIQESLLCNVPFRWQQRMTYAFQVSTFVFFVFPMTVITVMYAMIGVKLKRSDFQGRRKTLIKRTCKTKAKKAVIRMLVAVVIAFFCQWAPFHAQRLMTSYVPLEMWTPTLIRFQSNLFYVSGVLYFSNSTINPVLYNLMSKKFRLAFKRTLCRCCYTAEELLELNGKCKSVYCSDRTSGHSMRYVANNIAKMSLSVTGIKNGNALLKPVTADEHYYTNGVIRTSPRTAVGLSHSTGQLNNFFPELDDAYVTSESPQEVVPILNSSTNSVGSFTHLERDSLIELKPLSSACSSTTQLQSRLILSSTGSRTNRGSFV